MAVGLQFGWVIGCKHNVVSCFGICDLQLAKAPDQILRWKVPLPSVSSHLFFFFLKNPALNYILIIQVLEALE